MPYILVLAYRTPQSVSIHDHPIVHSLTPLLFKCFQERSFLEYLFKLEFFVVILDCFEKYAHMFAVLFLILTVGVQHC